MLWADGALRIADKLIDLLKLSEERRRRMFKEIVDPLFVEMTDIHQNYLSTFEEILEQLRKRPQPIEVVRNLLVEKKADLEHLRVKVTAFVQVYGEKKGESARDVVALFCEAIIRYFGVASGRAPGYRGRITDLLESMDEQYFDTERRGKYDAIAMVYKYRTESGQLVGDDFGYKLYEVIQAVRESWNDVRLAYAQAKVELMK